MMDFNLTISKAQNGYSVYLNDSIIKQYVFDSLPAMQLWLVDKIEEIYGDTRQEEYKQPGLPFEGGPTYGGDESGGVGDSFA